MRFAFSQFGALAALLLAWQLLAVVFASDLLPGPGPVFATVLREFHSGDLLLHTGVTLGRVLAAFFLAMSIGAVCGFAMGWWRRLDDFFDAWLIVFLNVPALVTIILCYVWFGLTEAAAILAVTINKVPNVAVTVREGARNLDPDLLAMARSFRLSRRRLLQHVVWPQIFPYMAVAARSGLALIWKIVLVVELLGRSNGVGFQLGVYFQLFDVPGILAYSVVFIMVIQVIEHGLVRPIERRATRWQR